MDAEAESRIVAFFKTVGFSILIQRGASRGQIIMIGRHRIPVGSFDLPRRLAWSDT